MAAHSILIADDFHPLLLQKLDSAAIAYSYQPNISREEIREELAKGAGGLVIRSKTFVDRELLSNATLLKFIARGGAGMDNIDEEVAAELGIACFNAAEGNRDAVGEHAVGMLLSLFRKINSADAEVRAGIWNREENRGIELGGKTIGIIGFGNTGSAFAQKLSGFNLRILAFDLYKKNFGNDLVEESTMENIFQLADIVSFHVPLNRHTKNTVNTDFLHRFVRNIFLLNLSRGQIVLTKDVILALKNGKILGFAADVLENENPLGMTDSDRLLYDELMGLPNTVFTPHVAAWTKESYEKISAVLASKICAQMAVLTK